MRLHEYLNESVSRGKPKPSIPVEYIDSDVTLKYFIKILDSMGYIRIDDKSGVLSTNFKGVSVYRITEFNHALTRVLVKNHLDKNSDHEYFRLMFDEHTGLLKYVQKINLRHPVGEDISRRLGVEELVKYLSEK